MIYSLLKFKAELFCSMKQFNNNIHTQYVRNIYFAVLCNSNQQNTNLIAYCVNLNKKVYASMIYFQSKQIIKLKQDIESTWALS